MRLTLIPMSVNNLFKVAIVVLFLLSPAVAFAVAGAVHDVHKLPSNDEFQETIEKRCTICHTRARVDQALENDEALDDLLQRMIERGAIVNERDQKVLGTFWGSPRKSDQQDLPERQ